MKDKTGLGLGLGRAPRDGRGPKTLRSVWRDWAEADEFRTVFEELTAEDIEKREIERERSTRYLNLFPLSFVCLNIFIQASEKRNVEIPELNSDETEMTFVIYFILFCHCIHVLLQFYFFEISIVYLMNDCRSHSRILSLWKFFFFSCLMRVDPGLHPPHL